MSQASWPQAPPLIFLVRVSSLFASPLVFNGSLGTLRPSFGSFRFQRSFAIDARLTLEGICEDVCSSSMILPRTSGKSCSQSYCINCLLVFSVFLYGLWTAQSGATLCDDFGGEWSEFLCYGFEMLFKDSWNISVYVYVHVLTLLI